MPTYCYETEGGQIVEEQFPVGKAPPILVLAGGQEVAKRCYQAERVSMPPSSDCWPMTCVASGVHPDQAGELREHFRKSGVPTEVKPDGDPVYRNARHRRKALKSRGQVDRNSFL